MGQFPEYDSRNERLKKRHTTWGWIFAGCGAILALGVVISLLFVFLMARGRTEFTPVVESFLARLEEHDFTQAYESLGPLWKDNETFDEFHDFVLFVNDALGAHESLRMTGVHYQNNLGHPPQAIAMFESRFEKAPAVLRVVLHKHDDQWKISGIHFESEVITRKLTCPHCATVNPQKARHCSTCGATIERTRDSAAERQRDDT